MNYLIFKCDYIKRLSNRLHCESADITYIARFQHKFVIEWYSKPANVTTMCIPPIFLRDENKTDMYGMAIIEILCLPGVIHKIQQTNDTRYGFVLVHNDITNTYIYMHG